MVHKYWSEMIATHTMIYIIPNYTIPKNTNKLHNFLLQIFRRKTLHHRNHLNCKGFFLLTNLTCTNAGRIKPQPYHA